MQFGSPEEMQAAIAEHQARHMMQHQDVTHRVSEFLNSMTDDELEIFERILISCIDNSHYIGYMRGQVDVIRETKFKMCRCGTNHEEEAKRAFEADRPVDGTSEAEAGVPTSDDGVAEIARLMEEYQVEVVPSDLQSHYPTEYRCSNCFTPIVSLDDRMRRDPGVEGCSGCQQASKHGSKWFER